MPKLKLTNEDKQLAIQGKLDPIRQRLFDLEVFDEKAAKHVTGIHKQRLDVLKNEHKDKLMDYFERIDQENDAAQKIENERAEIFSDYFANKYPGMFDNVSDEDFNRDYQVAEAHFLGLNPATLGDDAVKKRYLEIENSKAWNSDYWTALEDMVNVYKNGPQTEEEAEIYRQAGKELPENGAKINPNAGAERHGDEDKKQKNDIDRIDPQYQELFRDVSKEDFDRDYRVAVYHASGFQPEKANQIPDQNVRKRFTEVSFDDNWEDDYWKALTGLATRDLQNEVVRLDQIEADKKAQKLEEENKKRNTLRAKLEERRREQENKEREKRREERRKREEQDDQELEHELNDLQAQINLENRQEQENRQQKPIPQRQPKNPGDVVPLEYRIYDSLEPDYKRDFNDFSDLIKKVIQNKQLENGDVARLNQIDWNAIQNNDHRDQWMLMPAIKMAANDVSEQELQAFLNGNAKLPGGMNQNVHDAIKGIVRDADQIMDVLPENLVIHKDFLNEGPRRQVDNIVNSILQNPVVEQKQEQEQPQDEQEQPRDEQEQHEQEIPHPNLEQQNEQEEIPDPNLNQQGEKGEEQEQEQQEEQEQEQQDDPEELERKFYEERNARLKKQDVIRAERQKNQADYQFDYDMFKAKLTDQELSPEQQKRFEEYQIINNQNPVDPDAVDYQVNLLNDLEKELGEETAAKFENLFQVQPENLPNNQDGKPEDIQNQENPQNQELQDLINLNKNLNDQINEIQQNLNQYGNVLNQNGDNTIRILQNNGVLPQNQNPLNDNTIRILQDNNILPQNQNPLNENTRVILQNNGVLNQNMNVQNPPQGQNPPAGINLLQAVDQMDDRDKAVFNQMKPLFVKVLKGDKLNEPEENLSKADKTARILMNGTDFTQVANNQHKDQWSYTAAMVAAVQEVGKENIKIDLNPDSAEQAPQYMSVDNFKGFKNAVNHIDELEQKLPENLQNNAVRKRKKGAQNRNQDQNQGQNQGRKNNSAARLLNIIEQNQNLQNIQNQNLQDPQNPLNNDFTQNMVNQNFPQNPLNNDFTQNMLNQNFPQNLHANNQQNIPNANMQNPQNMQMNPQNPQNIPNANMQNPQMNPQNPQDPQNQIAQLSQQIAFLQQQLNNTLMIQQQMNNALIRMVERSMNQQAPGNQMQNPNMQNPNMQNQMQNQMQNPNMQNQNRMQNQPNPNDLNNNLNINQEMNRRQNNNQNQRRQNQQNQRQNNNQNPRPQHQRTQYPNGVPRMTDDNYNDMLKDGINIKPEYADRLWQDVSIMKKIVKRNRIYREGGTTSANILGTRKRFEGMIKHTGSNEYDAMLENLEKLDKYMKEIGGRTHLTKQEADMFEELSKKAKESSMTYLKKKEDEKKARRDAGKPEKKSDYEETRIKSVEYVNKGIQTLREKMYEEFLNQKTADLQNDIQDKLSQAEEQRANIVDSGLDDNQLKAAMEDNIAETLFYSMNLDTVKKKGYKLHDGSDLRGALDDLQHKVLPTKADINDIKGQDLTKSIVNNAVEKAKDGELYGNNDVAAAKGHYLNDRASRILQNRMRQANVRRPSVEQQQQLENNGPVMN